MSALEGVLQTKRLPVSCVYCTVCVSVLAQKNNKSYLNGYTCFYACQSFAHVSVSLLKTSHHLKGVKWVITFSRERLKRGKAAFLIHWCFCLNCGNHTCNVTVCSVIPLAASCEIAEPSSAKCKTTKSFSGCGKL